MRLVNARITRYRSIEDSGAPVVQEWGDLTRKDAAHVEERPPRHDAEGYDNVSRTGRGGPVTTTTAGPADRPANDPTHHMTVVFGPQSLSHARWPDTPGERRQSVPPVPALHARRGSSPGPVECHRVT